MSNILIVEDDVIISEFVARGLRESGHSVQSLGSAEAGLDLVPEGEFDLLIVDVMLPGIDGLSMIEQLRAQGYGGPILILSARRQVDDRVAGLRRGGDDYLTKPFSADELLARADALLRRPVLVQPAGRIEKHGVILDLFTRQVYRDGLLIALQPREFSLLEYLMRNEGRVVSRTMIIERVWRFNFDPSTNIVEARVSKLREKLERDFEEPLIHTVRGMGYVFRRGGADG